MTFYLEVENPFKFLGLFTTWTAVAKSESEILLGRYLDSNRYLKMVKASKGWARRRTRIKRRSRSLPCRNLDIIAVNYGVAT